MHLNLHHFKVFCSSQTTKTTFNTSASLMLKHPSDWTISAIPKFYLASLLACESLKLLLSYLFKNNYDLLFSCFPGMKWETIACHPLTALMLVLFLIFLIWVDPVPVEVLKYVVWSSMRSSDKLLYFYFFYFFLGGGLYHHVLTSLSRYHTRQFRSERASLISKKLIYKFYLCTYISFSDNNIY